MYLGLPGLLHLSCSFFCKYKGTFISFLYLLLQQMRIEPHGALQGLGGRGEWASALQGALPGGRGWEEGQSQVRSPGRPAGEDELFSSWGFRETAERRLKMGLGPDTQRGLRQEEGSGGSSRPGEGQRAGCGGGSPGRGWAWRQGDSPKGDLLCGVRAVAGKVAGRCLGGLKCPAEECGLAHRPWEPPDFLVAGQGCTPTFGGSGGRGRVVQLPLGPGSVAGGHGPAAAPVR